MHACSSLLLFCLIPFTSAAQISVLPADAVPLYDGYVTAVSPQGIEVNGAHLRFTPDSVVEQHGTGQTELTHVVPGVYLGEPAKVFGKLDKHTATVTVTQFTLFAAARAQLSGVGIIDAIPVGTATATRVVRADGRLLTIGPESAVTFVAPLTPETPLRTNLWIRYRGEQQPDGTVLIREAEIRENVVVASESKLRQKHEYDPAAVEPDSHQSATSKFFHGLQLNQIPPWPDAAMQTRVQTLGDRLILAYQRALPESDPTKIHFRFQVIDETHFKDAITLPNGIIVVPHQVIERLENDTQLATVLADNIATAIEKQTFRSVPAAHRMSAAQIAGSAGGILVPGLGVATSVANYQVGKHLLAMEEQQSGRVSLGYLHDAGFDIAQAPRTWWLLGTRNAKPLAQTALPPRAANLFLELGRSWRDTVSPRIQETARAISTP